MSKKDGRSKFPKLTWIYSTVVSLDTFHAFPRQATFPLRQLPLKAIAET
jgi:hypothetical protein